MGLAPVKHTWLSAALLTNHWDLSRCAIVAHSTGFERSKLWETIEVDGLDVHPGCLAITLIGVFRLGLHMRGLEFHARLTISNRFQNVLYTQTLPSLHMLADPAAHWLDTIDETHKLTPETETQHATTMATTFHGRCIGMLAVRTCAHSPLENN